MSLPVLGQYQEFEVQAFVLSIPEPKNPIRIKIPVYECMCHLGLRMKIGYVTVKGRKLKPLLIARPVRASPKSTPRLKPPLHVESRFRRMAFGRISSTDNA